MISFAYCIRFDGHEKEVGEIALAMGFTQVSLSSSVMPMIKIVPRGYTGILFLDTMHSCSIIGHNTVKVKWHTIH